MNQLNNSIDKRIFEVADHGPGDPTAGNNKTWDVQVNERVELLSINFLLTTDATAANRMAIVNTKRNSTAAQHALPKGIQTASETCQYYFSVGIAGEDEIANHGIQAAALPTDFTVGPGDQIIISVSALQATDAITGIRFRYKRWITE